MANSIRTKGFLPVVFGVLGVGTASAADPADATNGAEPTQTNTA